MNLVFDMMLQIKWFEAIQRFQNCIEPRCEAEEVSTLEQACPVTDVVVERNEEFYDQSYVSDQENAASEVSLSEGQVWKRLHRHTYGKVTFIIPTIPSYMFLH